MAKVISQQLPVRLWAPNDDLPADLPLPAEPFPRAQGAFRAALEECAAVVLSGAISARYFDRLATANLQRPPPLVVDLCDPFLIEHWQYPELGAERHRYDWALLQEQLQRGDFFLAASPQQRLYYLGLLTALGRLTPPLYRQDPGLDRLLAIAPFGVDPSAFARPAPPQPRLKGSIPGVALEDTVLFFGALYDWYNVDDLTAVLAPLCRRFKGLRVLFSRVPTAEVTPQRQLQRLADDPRWRGRIFIIPWFPYHQRHAYYRDIDLAVVLHRPSLETELSFRIRVLDYLNAAIPVVASSGGGAAPLIAQSGAGCLVPVGDKAALEQALSERLADAQRRRQQGSQGQQWVQRHCTWQQTLAPLIAFCRAPRHHPTAQSARPRLARWQQRYRQTVGYWQQYGSWGLAQKLYQRWQQR